MVVTDVSAEQIRDVFDVRRALEVAAVRLAAERRDPRPFEELRDRLRDADALVDVPGGARQGYYELAGLLDEAIDGAIHNDYLRGPLRTVRAHAARIRRISRDNPTRLRDAAREHLMITDAIIDGDPRVAAHAMELHLHRSLASMLATLAQPLESTADSRTARRRKA